MPPVLVNQPNARPTRKMFAVILATFIVQGFLGVLEYYFPGISSALPGSEWIELLVPLFVGYMTKERQWSDSSSSSPSSEEQP